ncbi:MAG: YidC/Oxa1 family membrane protein insertase [Lactobacillus sp.]|nr:YidC/Oxa1 family membrane protein insertase [Lactobacillus sp.]MDN6042544.1 YidC/Oxa1 family membrane protein insertase [Lactobacillus sp.]MDN6052639.1 YidC/Oxa1 family membrane protein insertase [Lactobacillus sp.]
MKSILTKRNLKRLLAVLAVFAIAIVLTGCANNSAGQNMAPVSHTSGSWWERWIIYYFSTFLLWLAKILNNNYGLAIIVFTVLIRILLFPLNALSIKSTSKMQQIQPQLSQLQKKYASRDAETQQLLREETSKLYKEAGVNPYTGCLPLLIQLPVMWILYMSIFRTPELQTGRFLWMDLGKPDPYYVMALLAMAFTFLSTYISQLSAPKASQTWMSKFMMYGMSLMVGVWAIYFQSAISLYWVISNLFQVIQTFMLQNPFKYRREQAAKLEAERMRKHQLRRAYKRIKRH